MQNLSSMPQRRQPTISKTDRSHPLYPIYVQYRGNAIQRGEVAQSFNDWLYDYERTLMTAQPMNHPRREEFVEWLKETKAGKRTSPVGLFPHNFYFWLEDGRW